LGCIVNVLITDHITAQYLLEKAGYTPPQTPPI
jgi:hypothetical protein